MVPPSHSLVVVVLSVHLLLLLWEQQYTSLLARGTTLCSSQDKCQAWTVWTG